MTIQYKPKLGRPFVEMRPDQVKSIVEGFGKVFAVSRVAGYAEVSRHHLKVWLERGDNDLNNGDNLSIYAQLFTQVSKRLTQKAEEYLAKLERCPDNAHCLTWLLSICMKQDYGQDSEEYKELASLYEKLLESFNKLNQNQPHGAINHGREMDTESD